jgi:hypothetical protein
MPRPSIVPELKGILEPWLESRMAEWNAMTAERRTPTLPMTTDGKISVRGLTLALGLKVSQEQHFFNHSELRLSVNAAAEAQGLKPIGSRAELDADDKVIADRVARIQGDRDDLSRILAEREAVIERQRREIQSLREQLRLLEETGMILRTGDLS